MINAAAGAGINYQVKIIVHYGAGADSGGDVYCNSKCEADFGDIRFTDDDGITLLDYWRGAKTDSDQATFWVEVADNLSSNPATIYVYYGKAGATTTSNFDNTFLFGDPFTSPTLDANRWPSIDGGPIYSIDDVNHYLEVTDMDANNWWTGKGFHSKAISLPDQWICEDAFDNVNGIYICQITTAPAQYNQGFFSICNDGWGTLRVAFAYLIDAWGSSSWGYVLGVGGNEDWNSGTQSGASVTKYFIIKKLSGNIKITDSGVLRVDEANSDVVTRVHLGISRYSTTVFGTERFGAFKIRKYVSPEPSHGAWGNAEIEITVSEPSISVSDSVSRIIRRDRQISEAPISVSDAAAYSLQRDRALSEPPISVVDLATGSVLPRMRSISEPPISVSDLVSVILRRERAVSESLGTPLDSVSAYKHLLKERSVMEQIGVIEIPMESRVSSKTVGLRR